MPRFLAFTAPVAMSLTGLCLLAFNHLGVGYPAATYDLGPIPKLQTASQDFSQRFVTPVLVDCCLRCPLLPCLPALSPSLVFLDDQPCLPCLSCLPSWLLPSLLLLPCLPALSIAAFVARVALYCLVSHFFMIHPGNHQTVPGTENTTPGKKTPREPETRFREPETRSTPRALSPSLVFLHDGCFRCSYGLVSQPCFPS